MKKSYHLSLVLASALLAYACGGSTPPVANPPLETSSPKTAKAPDPDQALENQKPAPSAETPKPAEPPPAPIAAMIGGTSVSLVTTEEVEAVAAKLGWKRPPSEMAMNVESKGRESRSLKVAKGRLAAEITIIRPVAGQAPDRNSNIADAATVAGSLTDSKDTAFFRDGEVLVRVTITGKRAEAQRLLDALVKKPK